MVLIIVFLIFYKFEVCTIGWTKTSNVKENQKINQSINGEDNLLQSHTK